MSDVDPIEAFGAPEIFCDGVAEIKIIADVARVTLHERQDGTRVVTGRLKIPLVELPDVIQSMVIAFTEAAKTIIKPTLSS